jgi:uncharacterized glyoxalase superfamily protein PhnB
MMKKTPRVWLSLTMLALIATVTSPSLRGINSHPPDSGQTPALGNICVISNNVKRLVDFYESILAKRAKWSGEDYAEFSTGGGVLAIFSEKAQEKYIPGASEAAKNRSIILEFKVADVDQEYQRLQSLVKTWVKPPSTQPWGTRSIYFRDPEGNLVDFYAPIKAP